MGHPKEPIAFGDVHIDPIDYASRGGAVLGIRDSGKTYTATYLAEALFDRGIPFTAFDPIGVWWSLRVPGAGRGYPVVVAGGQHADLPLTPETAPQIVRAAMQAGVSLVIDLFDINLSKADWRRIVADCIRVMVHENPAYGLRHVFLEEAAEFCPQRVGPDAGRVYAEVEKLARMGGNSALGFTLVNQRAEEVNKAVLELCDYLFLHRQKGRHSITALSKWMDAGAVVDVKAITGTLSTLPTGECWAWVYGSERPVRVHVPEKSSAHPDRRREIGGAGAPLHPIAADEFVGRLRASLAAAKAETPDGPAKVGAAPQALPAAQEAAIRDEAFREGYMRGHAEGRGLGIAVALGHLRPMIAELETAMKAPAESAVSTVVIDRFVDKDTGELMTVNADIDDSGTMTRLHVRANSADQVTVSGEAAVTPAKMKVLAALRFWEALGFAEIDRTRACIVTGLSPKASTFGVYIAELRRAGLIETGPGTVTLTDFGRSICPAAAERPSPAQVRKMARDLFTPATQRVFDAIAEAYPESISRQDLADNLGLSRTASTLGVYISEIGGLGFLSAPKPGHVRMAEFLFPNGKKR